LSGEEPENAEFEKSCCGEFLKVVRGRTLPFTIVPPVLRRISPVLILLGVLSGGVLAKPRERPVKIVRQKASNPVPSFGPSMRFNRATGLYHQRVRVTNDSGAVVNGFEIKVSGMGTRLKLVSGKRAPGGGTYSYAHALAAGKSVTVILSYKLQRRGTLRRPDVSYSFILPPPELPPLQEDGVTGGSLTLGGSGTVGSGSNTYNGATDISPGTLELTGGPLIVDLSGSFSEQISVTDPARALEWLDPGRIDIGDAPLRRDGNLFEIERLEVLAGDGREIFSQTEPAQP
jgi:hypothetical protein